MKTPDLTKFGDNVRLVCSDDVCSVYNLTSPSGEGIMTCYDVFPGVFLQYNDFHMESLNFNFTYNNPLFCIDHCREGRIEWEQPDGRYYYLGAGDMQIGTRCRNSTYFSSPLRHYHGITTAFSLDEANDSLKKLLEGVDIDIHKLIDKFACLENPFVMRAHDSIQHVFSELYRVPESIRLPYCKVKILELLVFLTGVEPRSQERPYFPRTQIDKIKAIERMMTSEPKRHFTLEELSAQYAITLTTLCSCFKEVFGHSVYSYMRNWRMNAAAVQLRQTDAPVITIASSLGYENASKFSSAFKAVMGKTPTEYRKSFV